MINTELNYLSASTALERFLARDLSPVELLEVVIRRAEDITASVNPFADRYFDEAFERARQAEQRYFDGKAHRLDGLPLLVKDDTPIKGKRATVGSLLHAHNVDTLTHPSVERLLRAGANCFARSTCPEFCWLFTCHSRLWGVTRNPWRLDVTPGGSSGGSAAALAAGATTLATGSDSAGSIRQPASQCGVVGYKPPYGRNPMDALSSFDPYIHVGPMARSVADVALMQNVMSGPHSLDHNSLRNRIKIPVQSAPVRGLKIAYSIDLGHYEVIDDVRRETRALLQALRDEGAEVDEIEVDWAGEAIRLAHLNEEFMFASMLEDAVVNHADEISDYVPQLLETAAAASADDFRRSQLVAGEVWRDYLGPLFRKYDVFITPSVSCPEVPADNWQRDVVVVNGKELTDTDTAMTALFNMFNRCPVLSVPAGMTDRGLPVGVQIIGRPYDDAMTFRIGYAIEALRPWTQRFPACC